MYLPAASMTVAPGGTRTDGLGPIAVMRCPVTTIIASRIGGPPFPSITVPPTIAWTAACCAAGLPTVVAVRKIPTASAIALDAVRVSIETSPGIGLRKYHKNRERASLEVHRNLLML